MAKDPSMGPGSTTTSAGAGYGSGAFGMDAEQARPYIPGRIPEQNFALNDGRTNRPGHNFLAPYSNTSDQTIAFSLATKDFLQPLERVERDKSERCYDVANPSSNQHLLCFKDKVENCWSSARLQCGIADAVAKIGSTVEPSLVNNHWQHQKSEILSSGKRSRQGSEDDDIEEVENADIRRRKRENGGQKKGLCKDESTSKITETSKPVSSRSKHSATEQRRRSKINDRFQMLRDLIPHGDQKRDKASFLLEVIEYIQILQEKLHKYDSTEEKTSLTATKIPQRNNDGPSNEKEDSEQLLDNKQIQQQQYTTTLPQQQQQCTSSNGVFHHENKVDETTVTNTSNSKKKNKKKKQAEEVTGGVISVSTGYSQRLLGTLADALQSSGVDLSQAKISVHINIGEAS